MASVESSSLNTLQISLSDVFTRVGVMIRRLAAQAASAGQVVPETRAFQLAFNANREAILDWYDALGVVTYEGTLAEEVMFDGLKDDGKYGAKTANALSGLLYAAGLQIEIIESLPLVAANIPLWYAQYHNVIEGVLLNVAASQTVPAVSTADIGSQTQDVVNTARGDGPIQVSPPSDLGGDFDFTEQEATPILSTAQRTGWNVPVWAIGLGLVTAGGLMFAVAKRRKKNARVAL